MSDKQRTDTNIDALWELFEKTGLPEAYMLYKAEERRIGGGDKG